MGKIAVDSFLSGVKIAMFKGVKKQREV